MPCPDLTWYILVIWGSAGPTRVHWCGLARGGGGVCPFLNRPVENLGYVTWRGDEYLCSKQEYIAELPLTRNFGPAKVSEANSGLTSLVRLLHHVGGLSVEALHCGGKQERRYCSFSLQIMRYRTRVWYKMYTREKMCPETVKWWV